LVPVGGHAVVGASGTIRFGVSLGTLKDAPSLACRGSAFIAVRKRYDIGRLRLDVEARVLTHDGEP